MSLFAVFTAIGFALFAACMAGLVWAVRSGQLDDLETPALRMLIDEEAGPTAPQEPKERTRP